MQNLTSRFQMVAKKMVKALADSFFCCTLYIGTQAKQWRIQGGQSGHAPPHSSDSLATNVEFDIGPREVRPSIGFFCLWSIDSQEN